MLTYVLRRILFSIPVLLAASFLVFTLVSALGDPLYVLRMNPLTSKETLAHIAAAKHLNDPIPLRYLYWLKDVFTQGFGEPLLVHHPIWRDLARVMPHTIQLVVSAELLALTLGVGIGIYSAIRQYSLFDYTFTSISFLGFAMPTFWLALLLQIAFTDIYLHWGVRIFYTSGLNSQPGGPAWSLDRMQHLALPVMTLLIISFALYSRYMRASMLDVINSDYVRTARAKGVSEWRVIMKHVFRNALIPLTTVAALNFGALIGGAIVTETVFSLDGFGFWFINALNSLDIYEMMAYIFITAVAVVVFNLIADILYGFLDPRIRYD